MTFWEKTQHFDKITAFDENHGCGDLLFRLYLLPVAWYLCNT